jgi:hypothetical protein
MSPDVHLVVNCTRQPKRRQTPETAVLIPVNDIEEFFQGDYLCLGLVAVPTQILPHPKNTPTTNFADEHCQRNWCVVFD